MEYNERSARRRRNPLILVIAAVALAVLILPAAGILALDVLTRLTQQLRSATGGDQPPATFVPQLSLVKLDRWPGTERVNILVLGIDQRPGENPEQARTDTMVLLTIDPQTGSAGMLNIPRDLYVPLPNGGHDRINTAHVYGGAEMAMKAVEFNFGLPVHHYVRINFDAWVELIDLIGGVDVYVEQDIHDPTFPDNQYGFEPFSISAGWHHLDGQTALKYARTRHGSSDFARMRRQQQIMLAVRDRLQTTDVFTRVLPNAPQILATLQDSIQTDLSPVEIVQLIATARDIPPEKIARAVVDETAVQEWTTPQGASVLIPVRSRIAELREKLYHPPPPPLVETVPPPPEPGTLAVHNGTQIMGLAAAAKEFLEGRGYTVLEVDNAPQTYSRSVIVDYTGRPGFIAGLAAQLGLPESAVAPAPDPNSRFDALVILGDDFRTPTPAPQEPPTTP